MDDSQQHHQPAAITTWRAEPITTDGELWVLLEPDDQRPELAIDVQRCVITELIRLGMPTPAYYAEHDR